MIYWPNRCEKEGFIIIKNLFVSPGEALWSQGQCVDYFHLSMRSLQEVSTDQSETEEYCDSLARVERKKMQPIKKI